MLHSANLIPPRFVATQGGTTSSTVLTLQKHASHDTMITKRAEVLGTQEVKACLVKIHPAVLGEGLIELPYDRFAIGRDLTCDLALPDDKAVSRSHAFITHTNSQYVISDGGSTNG